MVRLAEGHDTAALARAYQACGRLHIPHFLVDEDAAVMHQTLRERTDWRQVLTTGSGYAELDRQTRAGMDKEKAKSLDDAVYAQARSGFQYRYESIRVPDNAAERAANDDPITRFAQWLSCGEGRDFLRAVTGADDVQFADAQATAYSPGDFLTGHDDQIAGKERRAAYVFGLTPIWRLEWGGLLLFHGGDGHVERGRTATLNSFNLFSVPQMHSVSEVTRAAAYRRYAVTGWLRAEAQPT